MTRPKLVLEKPRIGLLELVDIHAKIFLRHKSITFLVAGQLLGVLSRRSFIPDYLRKARALILQKYQFNSMYEEKVRRFYDLDSSTSFLDIGSNIGFYSCMMAPKCAKVHCWEPNPQTAKTLTKKTRKFRNITVHVEALGSQKDTVPFYLHSDSGHDGLLQHMNQGTYLGKSINVNVRPLDSYDFSNEKIGLIKIDVEGYELEVIKGALKTINAHKPRIIIDLHDTRFLRTIMDLLPGYNWQSVEEISGIIAHIVGVYLDKLQSR